MDSTEAPETLPKDATVAAEAQLVPLPPTPQTSARAHLPAKPDVLPPPKVTGEFNVLCYTLLSLFIVSFAAWLTYAWTGYGKRYPSHAEGWYKGGVRSIEITVVAEDARNLSCASDVEVDGLQCAFRANQQPFDGNGSDDRVTLRPYNTVDSVLFLGAGLWSSPALAAPLPHGRFTVVCNYHMVSAVKSVSLRWSATGSFDAVKDALPVGSLTDCVIPR
ncbi:MAG TPA: hypothetical protein VF524_07365 [Polyangia bacterium]